MPVIFRRLTPDHVDLLVDLEQKLFPPSFHLGAAKFYYYLSTAEIKGKNYSVGAFDGDELVGYLLMVNHPSDFFPPEEVAYVISIAVRMRYRRSVVKPMMEWITTEALVTGHNIEGKMRESTAFRMIQRNSSIIRKKGFRIARMYEMERVGDDRMIDVRFEHIFSRDPLVFGAYHALAAMERGRRKLRVLPRRALRKVCHTLPEGALPIKLRRLSYLEQPQEEPHHGSVPS